MANSTHMRVHFKSSLFGSDFGAGLLIAPNTIDFEQLFKDFPVRLNAVRNVLALHIALYCLFILGLILARRKDKLDLLKVSYYSLLRPIIIFLAIRLKGRICVMHIKIY